MRRDQITAAYVRGSLQYDQETGVLTWSKDQGRARAGDVAGGVRSTDGYITIGLYGNKFHGHRLAYAIVNGEWPNFDIDHINGQRSDNRWSNLRAATRSENNQNIRGARPGNKTGLLGVHQAGRKFRASIKLAGVRTDLGMFDTAEAAHRAYINKKGELHPFFVKEL